MILILSKKQHTVDAVVLEFKRDYELYLEFVAWDGKEPADIILMERSVFRLTAVMQLVHAFTASGWKAATTKEEKQNKQK